MNKTLAKKNRPLSTLAYRDIALAVHSAYAYQPRPAYILHMHIVWHPTSGTQKLVTI